MRLRTNGDSYAISCDGDSGPDASWWTLSADSDLPDGIYPERIVLAWEGWRELVVLDPDDATDAGLLARAEGFIGHHIELGRMAYHREVLERLARHQSGEERFDQ